MIIFQSWGIGTILWILLPIAVFEEAGPAYDTGDWIPIVPEETKSSNRESKSSDRILNVDVPGEKFVGEEKLPAKKSYITQHRPRKNPHIKRSPNHRPRIKLDQPYRYENILSPPPKQQVRDFQQKNPYQQSFNLQPQYQFNIPKPGQILSEDAYRQFPLPPNPSIYNLNNLQVNPTVPSYSSPQLGIPYQQSGIIPQVPTTNNTIYKYSGSTSINQGLYENIRNQNLGQNTKQTAPGPSEDKGTVQLLYVPLEQLQKQQGLLDEAFESLQQQKLVAPPPQADSSVKLPNAQPLVAQPNIQQDYSQQEVNQHRYQLNQNQPVANEESENYYSLQNSAKRPEKQTQYYVLQNTPLKNEEEPPRYYELVSKNHGELILQNNPKTVEVSNKNEYQVQAEKQQIIELTTPQPIQNHQVHYNTRFEHEERQQPQNLVQQIRNQDGRSKYLKKEPQVEQSFIVQNQISQPLSVEAPKLQHSYTVRNQPEQSVKQNYFQDDFKADQKSRLKNIQQDILQQTLQVEKLQKQIQQGKSLDFPEKNTSLSPKKRKPHQPPLAVYMGGHQPGDVESVLELLKNAKSIAVQDQIGPNSPQVFIGPSNLNAPDGFAKFPLPYLSNLDNSRIQRKAQQFPFFVAPINYKEPEGYSKIPLPSPHVGSVVVSQFKRPQIQNLNDNFQESNRPVAITNYKFVNPAFTATVDNSHFDDNLNAYSLESQRPRDNSNRHLKEQTLLQQITGFSGLEFPQNQYFSEQLPNVYNQVPEIVSSKPQTNQHQYLEEVQQEPQVSSVEEIPQMQSTTPTSRQRLRGEKTRGHKKGSSAATQTITADEVEKNTEANIPKAEIKVPEVPTPDIVQSPEKVEISSQNPLTQDFLNRFSSNNNFNFNYVSSTPGYAIPNQSSVEELPANIRKLNVNQNPDVSNIRNSPVVDTQFEQTIANLQNSRQNFNSPKEEKRVHVYNAYEEFELPSQLSNINPNLPGLINELQQPQFTTPKLETDPPVPSTTLSTTQFTIKTTEATTTTTTTRKSRGRGRSRFNMRTTTSSPYRRTSGERRRPSKTTVSPTTEATHENSFKSNRYSPIENERSRPRARLQNSLTERVAEGSIESTSPVQQSLQPITRVMDISQNQPNYYVQFQSAVANERPVLRDYVEEPKTEGVKVVEQFLSQKVTPAEQLAPQEEEYPPIRQISVKPPDRSEQARSEVTRKLPEVEATTRRRVRVRGRPKNKYSSTTIAPRTTSTEENEQSEFYGFIRQPNFSQSSQISSNTRNEEDNIHIYAPTQQKSPIYQPKNIEPTGPSSPSSVIEPTRFLGELRPKYGASPRATTTQQPETTQKSRTRGRVRIPGKQYESRSKATDNSLTEKSSRVRTRGSTHFTAPRNIRQEVDNEETENYPAPYLKSREAATTPSSSEFKITVSMDDQEPDQIPHSSVNRPEQSRESITEAPANPQRSSVAQEGIQNVIYNNEYEVPDDKMEVVSFRRQNTKGEGFRVVNVDQFDTAESQNYRTLFNSLDSPHKVNDLKSVEMEETSTEPSGVTTEKTENPTNTETAESQKTSIDDNLNTTILESVRGTIENATFPSLFTTTEIQETTVATTTEDTQNTTDSESTDATEITSTLPPEETKTNPATEAKLPEQTPLDLLLLKTSTSTEISHETEICFKGRCVKSKNKKFRKRLLRKKVNETNNN